MSGSTTNTSALSRVFQRFGKARQVLGANRVPHAASRVACRFGRHPGHLRTKNSILTGCRDGQTTGSAEKGKDDQSLQVGLENSLPEKTQSHPFGPLQE